MKKTELKKALLEEIRCRADAASVGVLAQDYGREATHEALKELYRAGAVRLVSGAFGIGHWCEQDGCSKEDYIERDGGWFVRVEAA
jgi:hypothetical protein